MSSSQVTVASPNLPNALLEKPLPGSPAFKLAAHFSTEYSKEDLAIIVANMQCLKFYQVPSVPSEELYRDALQKLSNEFLSYYRELKECKTEDTTSGNLLSDFLCRSIQHLLEVTKLSGSLQCRSGNLLESARASRQLDLIVFRKESTDLRGNSALAVAECKKNFKSLTILKAAETHMTECFDDESLTTVNRLVVGFSAFKDDATHRGFNQASVTLKTFKRSWIAESCMEGIFIFWNDDSFHSSNHPVSIAAVALDSHLGKLFLSEYPNLKTRVTEDSKFLALLSTSNNNNVVLSILFLSLCAKFLSESAMGTKGIQPEISWEIL